MANLMVSTISTHEAIAQSKSDGQSIYAGLRDLALKETPADLGLKLDDADTVPYGVVMDISMSKGTATWLHSYRAT